MNVLPTVHFTPEYLRGGERKAYENIFTQLYHFLITGEGSNTPIRLLKMATYVFWL